MFSVQPRSVGISMIDHLTFLLKPLLVSQVTWNTIPTPSLSSKALHHLPCLPPQGLYSFHLRSPHLYCLSSLPSCSSHDGFRRFSEQTTSFLLPVFSLAIPSASKALPLLHDWVLPFPQVSG